MKKRTDKGRMLGVYLVNTFGKWEGIVIQVVITKTYLKTSQSMCTTTLYISN